MDWFHWSHHTLMSWKKKIKISKDHLWQSFTGWIWKHPSWKWASPHTGLQAAHLFIYFNPKQSSAHPHILFRTSCTTLRLKCDECLPKQPSENTDRNLPVRIPACCTMVPCVNIFPPWLSPDKCDVCSKGLHVVPLTGSSRGFYRGKVYSPLNVKGLSPSAAPEPPAGSASALAHFLKHEKQALFFLPRNMMDIWWLRFWEFNHFHAVFSTLAERSADIQ